MTPSPDPFLPDADVRAPVDETRPPVVLDPALLGATEDPFEAEALVYALAMAEVGTGTRAEQQRYLDVRADPAHLQYLSAWADTLAELPPDAQLSLLERCGPALRLLPGGRRHEIERVMDGLFDAGHVHSLRRFAHTVTLHFIGHRPSAEVLRRLELSTDGARPFVRTVLGALSRAVHAGDSAVVAAAYRDGYACVFEEAQEGALPGARTYRAVLEALDRLRGASKELRQQLIDGCVRVVLRDREALPDERCLLRSFCTALGVSIPAEVRSWSVRFVAAAPDPAAGAASTAQDPGGPLVLEPGEAYVAPWEADDAEAVADGAANAVRAGRGQQRLAAGLVAFPVAGLGALLGGWVGFGVACAGLLAAGGWALTRGR